MPITGLSARGFVLPKFMVVLVFLAFAPCLKAEEVTPTKKPTVEELEARIRVLEERLSRLEVQNGARADTSASDLAQAGSQAPAPTSPPHPVAEQQAASATEANPQIFAGPGGFSFQSADGADQIRFHGEFDFDGRFYDDNLTPDGQRSTWLLRRARPIIEGTFANIFDFRFNPDFAGGKTVIQDAFVAARFNPLFIVTAGKFKEPFGLERLQLSPNNRFIELGLPSDLVPNRDLGLQVSGTWSYGTGNLTYQAGWFDGVMDGSSTDANTTPDIDNNDAKDWVARLFAQPFLNSSLPALKGLGVGAAVSYVNQTGSATNSLLPVYKTETQRAFFSYDPARAATNALPAAGAAYADGQRLRYSPQAFYYVGSFGLLSEYVRESQAVARKFGGGTEQATVHPESWQVAATYLLTGDKATFGTVVPNRPFRLNDPGWGAFEVAARFSELDLGEAPFGSTPALSGNWFADPSRQARKALAYTVGLNWYLTQNVAWYVDYTATHFDLVAPGAYRNKEEAFFTRFQVAF